MKHLFQVLLFFFVFNTLNIYGQIHEFRPGLIINFNGIHIEGDKSTFWDHKSGKIWGTGGISYGAYVTYGLNSIFSVSGELRFIRKGALYEYLNQYGNRNFENLKLRYLEVPLLFGCKFHTKKLDYLLETGVGYAKLTHSEMLFNELTEQTGLPEAKGFKKADITWVSDLKVYTGKSENFLIGLRFSYSILSIHEVYSLHNMVYGIELNYLLFKT